MRGKGFAFCFGLGVVAGVCIGEGEDAEGFEVAVFVGEIDVLEGGWVERARR